MEPGLQLEQGVELASHLEPLVTSNTTNIGNIDRAPIDFQVRPVPQTYTRPYHFRNCDLGFGT